MNELKIQITQWQYNYLLKGLLNMMSNSQHVYQYMEQYYTVVEPIPKSGDLNFEELEIETDLHYVTGRVQRSIHNEWLDHLTRNLEAGREVPRVRNQRGPRYPVYFDESYYTPNLECIWREGTTAQEWLEHRRVCKRDLLKCLSREKE